MTRSKRLQPVKQITEIREKDAAKLLGESKQELQQLQHQLAELERYRQEYRGHYQQNGSAGFSAQRLQELQQFLAKIDLSIVQQEQAIVTAEGVCEEKKQLWLQARGKTHALGKVVERYQQDEQQQQNRREQRENDEYAQRGRGADKK